MENIDLLGKAQQDLIADMKERNIGAILWDNATAGFQYIPEIDLAQDDAEEPDCSRIMGLYRYDDELYLIEEDKSKVDFNRFYNPDTEVKPSVVTLTESVARGDLGDPTKEPGYTTDGSLEEWLAIADCYFEALNEAREEQPE